MKILKVKKEINFSILNKKFNRKKFHSNEFFFIYIKICLQIDMHAFIIVNTNG